MTAKEALVLANSTEKQDSNRPIIRQWLASAAARDILEFIHGLAAGWNERHMPAARASLDVRLAEDAAKQSEALQQQIATLVGIAEAQRVLAAKLERQTNKLIILTWVLAFLTAALLFHEVLKEHSTALPPNPSADTNAHNVEPAPRPLTKR